MFSLVRSLVAPFVIINLADHSPFSKLRGQFHSSGTRVRQSFSYSSWEGVKPTLVRDSEMCEHWVIPVTGIIVGRQLLAFKGQRSGMLNCL